MVFMAVTMLLALVGAIYLWTRFHRFQVIQRISGGRKVTAWLIAALPLLFAGAFLYLDLLNTVIVLIHLAVFWVLADLGAFFISWYFKKVNAKKKTSEQNVSDTTEKTLETKPAETPIMRESPQSWLPLFIYLQAGIWRITSWKRIMC